MTAQPPPAAGDDAGSADVTKRGVLGVTFPVDWPSVRVPDWARLAETLGYEELWVAEDCFYSGGIAAASAALAVTKRIRVGLGILPAVMRNPAVTAMEIATLASLYPGRVIGGIGHGMPDWMRQIGAYPASSLAALEEVLQAVRLLLAGETVSLAGKHVRLREVTLDCPPAQVPPVVAGVRGPRSLEVAARAADGTMLAHFSGPRYVSWARQHIDQAAPDPARPHPIVVAAAMRIAVEGAAARRAIRPALAAALAGPGLATQLAPAHLADQVRDLLAQTIPADPAQPGTPSRAASARTAQPASPAALAGLADAIPEAWIEELTVAGDPGQCVQAIRSLYQAGAATVLLTPAGSFAEASAQLALASATVLPAIR